MTQKHDPILLCLALVICLIATGTTLRLMHIGRSTGRAAQTQWPALAAACAASGTWSTHFIAMLAFDPGIGTGYDLGGTVISFLVALLLIGVSVFAISNITGRWRAPAWGLLFAIGVGAMHYTGMSAFRAAGTQALDPSFVIASLAVGAVAATGSLWLFERGPGVGWFIAAAFALTLSICGLHLLGMAGMTITPDPRVLVPRRLMPNQLLGLLVGAISTLIIAAALLTVWIERRSSQASMRLLRTVLSVLPQAVAYYDADDQLIFSNDAYGREVELRGHDIPAGATFREILSLSAYSGAVPAALGREEAWISSLVDIPPGGSTSLEQPMSGGRVLRVDHSRTEDSGRLVVLSDITELKQQAEELRTARDLAQAATRAKSEFLANMSHELRTPMNGVLAVADMLSGEPLTPRQAELVEIIRSSGSMLNRLLSDILDITRIEAGAIELEAAPFDPAHEAEDVVSLFRPKAQQKGLSIRVEVEAPVTGLFVGDAERLKQVLCNLVDNAVKFTHEGGVTLRVARWADGLCFSVCDTGIGFEPAESERLFRRFEQEDSSNTRRYGGSGLGLALARELAVRMGGELTCESAPGKGSTFTLQLPAKAVVGAVDTPPEPQAEAKPQAPVEAEAYADDAAYEPLRLLVVDDNAVNRQVMGMLLESFGMEADFAEDGQQALDQWRLRDFDGILMDIQMPVLDGLAATRIIRQEEAAGRRRTPIVVVSANAMPEHLAASAEAGADHHLPKPVTAASLMAVLTQVFQEDAAHSEAA